jgi:hypothetical protein
MKTRAVNVFLLHRVKVCVWTAGYRATASGVRVAGYVGGRDEMAAGGSQMARMGGES